MVFLDRGRNESLYMQIYTQIKREITEGVLKENSLLPGSRVMAKTLQVSRNTVDNAYNQLSAEGYILATLSSDEFKKGQKNRDTSLIKMYLCLNNV